MNKFFLSFHLISFINKLNYPNINVDYKVKFVEEINLN